MVGTQAPRQSSHAGQLEVAQPSQTSPSPQDSQAFAVQGARHSPVLNTQMRGAHSSWEVQNPPVEVDVLLEVPLPPAPPSPES